MGTLKGRAIVTDSRSMDLGGFEEVISPAAIRSALSRRPDVLALWSHDSGEVLARASSGTLKLSQDGRGLLVEIDLPNTGRGRDTAELVGRRDVKGMSFGFQVLEDTWHREGNTLIRTVTDMVLVEISPVALPAYPATTLALVTA